MTTAFYNPAYFVAIVEAGSLSKAAERLYLSQPSLSQYVKRLERNLGVELFDRSTSPLRLTFLGERYYQYVRQFMELDENAKREFRDYRNHTSGRLRLGVALWRGACILPDVFPEFHMRYPDIQLELLEARSNQLENAILNDQIDFAIMNLPQIANYGKLTCDLIFEERILLAAPTQHPLVQELLKNQPETSDLPVAPLELVESIPLILTKPGQNLTKEIRYVLELRHIEPNVLLETANLTTAINLTAQGIACAFVPEEGAKVCQHLGKVTYFRVSDDKFSWPLAVIYRKGAYLTQLSKLFIDALKTSLNSGFIHE